MVYSPLFKLSIIYVARLPLFLPLSLPWLRNSACCLADAPNFLTVSKLARFFEKNPLYIPWDYSPPLRIFLLFFLGRFTTFTWDYSPLLPILA